MRTQGVLLSLTEAAQHKGVHYQTVRRAISRGDLKAVKVGGGVVIAATDLDIWQPKYKHAPSTSRHLRPVSGPEAPAATAVLPQSPDRS